MAKDKDKKDEITEADENIIIKEIKPEKIVEDKEAIEAEKTKRLDELAKKLNADPTAELRNMLSNIEKIYGFILKSKDGYRSGSIGFITDHSVSKIARNYDTDKDERINGLEFSKCINQSSSSAISFISNIELEGYIRGGNMIISKNLLDFLELGDVVELKPNVRLIKSGVEGSAVAIVDGEMIKKTNPPILVPIDQEALIRLEKHDNSSINRILKPHGNGFICVWEFNEDQENRLKGLI